VEDERRFSVEEANELLGGLRERLERIRDMRRKLLASAEVVSDRAAGNGGGLEGASYFEALQTLRQDVEAVIEAGAVLRDPETGLVDFPSEREGRRIFLCWRLGEDRVGYWHDEDSGFAGRRPV
jgi:hypothetical protein